MKTKIIKDKSILADLRSIRDKISEELKGKTTEQIIEYLKAKKTLHPTSYWQSPIRKPEDVSTSAPA